MGTESRVMRRLILTIGAAGLSVWVAGLAVFVHRMNYSVTFNQVTQWVLGHGCEDFHDNCASWAQALECTKNPGYMSAYCAKACKLCSVSQSNHSVSENNTGRSRESISLKNNAEGRTHEYKAIPQEDNHEDNEDGEEDTGDYEDSDDAPRESNQGSEDQEESFNQVQNSDEKEVDEEDEDDGDEDDGDELPDHKLCRDLASEDDCRTFQEDGECENNSDWMNDNCRRSCGACPVCSDGHKLCKFWAKAGECEANPGYMLVNCARSCKSCVPEDDTNGQIVTDSATGKQLVCKDKHHPSLCASRRAQGECELNPGWMTVFCGKTCGKCDLLAQSARCVPEVFNDTSYVYDDALKKGDLHRVFERILEEVPNVEVVLRPPENPWVIKLPNFVTDLERERILAMTLPHVKRSTDQGSFNEEGIQEQVVSTGRTSSNAWCMGECTADPVVMNLTERISKLTRVPVKNFESFQVLQYKVSQKYDVHHDASDEDRNNLSGPRILTFFIYLSDVEEGGETFFDKLKIKIKPQKGMAILWPSVLNDNPRKVDWRTTHAALPVIKGEKLAANVWMHQNDFATPNLWGCTGPLTSN